MVRRLADLVIYEAKTRPATYLSQYNGWSTGRSNR